jgi:hypothetical protein
VDNFDPYKKWLGISPKHQPPNHYRLLGLEVFEADADTIEHAGDRQMSHVRTFQAGRFVDASQKLLNELSAAKICLLNPDKKSAYDAELSKLSPKAAKAAPPKKQSTSQRATPVATAAPASARPAISVNKKRGAKKTAAPAPGSSSLPLPLPLLIAGGIGSLVIMAIIGMLLFSGGAPKPSPAPSVAIQEDDPVVDPTTPVEETVQPEETAGTTDPTNTVVAGVAEKDPFGAGAVATTTPAIKPVQLASVEIETPCEVGTLAVGATAFLHGPSAIESLDPRLAGKSYTRSSNINVALRATSGGPVYVIHWQSDRAIDAEIALFPQSRKTDIVCQIRYNSTVKQCTVYEISPHTGMHLTLRRNGGVPPILVAADIQVVAKQEPLVKSKPSKPVEEEEKQPEQPKRLTVPTQQQQQETAKSIAEIFNPRAAKTLEEIQTMSKTLIEQGKAAGGAVNDQYVMLYEGAKMAALAGDLEAASAAANQLEQKYDTDISQLRIDILRQMLKAKLLPDAKKKTFLQALPLVDMTMQSGNFAAADSIISGMISGAKRLRDKEIMTGLADRKKLSTVMGREFRLVKEHEQTLLSKPDDPEANALLGRYECFVRGDWEKGLPMLAKGNDEKLKTLANLEQKKNRSSTDLMALANGWYEHGKDQAEPLQLRSYQRAKDWYKKAEPVGIAKVLADKNLAVIEKAIKGHEERTRPKVRYPLTGFMAAAADYRFDVYVNGQSFFGASSSSNGYSGKGSRIFNKGDVITVRARRNKFKRAFAAVMLFQNTKVYVGTGMPNSGWRSYRPSSESYWYKPQGISDVQNIIASSPGSSSASRVAAVTKKNCRSIWGHYNTSPSSSFGYTYLFFVFN